MKYKITDELLKEAIDKVLYINKQIHEEFINRTHFHSSLYVVRVRRAILETKKKNIKKATALLAIVMTFKVPFTKADVIRLLDQYKDENDREILYTDIISKCRLLDNVKNAKRFLRGRANIYDFYFELYYYITKDEEIYGKLNLFGDIYHWNKKRNFIPVINK